MWQGGTAGSTYREACLGSCSARYLNTRAGSDTGRSAFGIHLMFASQPVDRTGAFANILSAAAPIRYSLNIHKYVAL